MADKGEFRFTDFIPYLVLINPVRLAIDTILDRVDVGEIFYQSMEQCRQRAAERWNLSAGEEDDKEDDEEDDKEDDEDVKI